MHASLTDLDFSDIVSAIQNKDKEKFKKNALDIYSTGSSMKFPTKPEEFVVGPKWWQDMTGLMGLPYGFFIQIAGKTDSGKTSAVIEFCRHAQQQDVVVVFVDTERKTTKTRFTQWGVDPDKLVVIRPKTLEQMYRGVDMALDTVQEKFPSSKILLIIDSLGNTPSETEMEADIADPVQMGKRANINNRGFSRLVPRLEDNISVLIINQTYDNMGSPGKQNKGGTTKEFACAVTFQTSRVGWIEGTVKGEKVRKGAKVKWNVYKHHLIDNQAAFQGKTFEIDITAEGMALKGELPDKFKLLKDDELTIDEETGEIIG